MKTKLSAAFISLVLLIAVAGSAMEATGSCCAPGGGAGGPAVLNELAPEQKQQVLTLRTELMKKMEAVRSEAAKKRIELMELSSQEKTDEAAIEKKRQEIWALQDSMRNEQRAMSTKLRTLLTPEQRQKMGPMGMGFGFGPGAGGCGGSGGAGCGGCPMRSSGL